MFAVIVLTTLSLILGALLGHAAVRFQVKDHALADRIEQVLPRIQCGQCGFPGCKGYAAALARGEAEINLCPPGGQVVLVALATLLRKEPPRRGMIEKPDAVAIINEATCIGCTLCRQACPVDAIVGAARQIHTIIYDECTGCELCVKPCPVGCITMVPLRPDIRTWQWPIPSAPTNKFVEFLMTPQKPECWK
ncbi:Ion-translocating oxidoreductase complex subunit B [Gammaproteobacteria bacterium]